MGVPLKSLAALLKLIKRSDNGSSGSSSSGGIGNSGGANSSSNSVLLDPEFKETVQRAQMIIDDWTQSSLGDRIDYVTPPIMSVVLSVFHVKKTRLIEAVFSTLQEMMEYACIPYDAPIILYQPQRNKLAVRCGEALFHALAACLAHVSDLALQMKGVGILHDVVSDVTFPLFTGKCVTRCVQICCQITLQTSHEVLRANSRDLLLLCVLRVTRAFVETKTPECQSKTFASPTVLDDYLHDVEPDANYTSIEVEGCETIETCEDSPDPLFSTTSHVQPMSYVPGLTSVSNGSLHPFEFFRSSLNDGLIKGALLGSQASEKLPNTTKDLLLLIKHTCKLATRTCSGSGSTSKGNPEVRARQLALEMLEAIFQELPLANCDVDHPCATWLSMVLTVTKYDILRCIARNLATIVPSCFFAISVRILTLLLRKCHYYLAREVHVLLAVMLFPLALSKFSSFSQKHAVVGMIRELVSVPDLCVSFFINYDCNPNFDSGAKYGGMLELIVDFIMEMMFADFFDPEWISSDQQQLLRSECVGAMHNFVESMQRWVVEDPREYMEQQVRKVAGQVISTIGNSAHQKVSRWHQVYLDNWESEEESEQSSPVSEVLSDELSISSSLMDGGYCSQKKILGNRGNIRYHWKHIHCLLQNKRIAQEALQFINRGHWREGMKLLQQRGYIPQTEEEGCWNAFAKFLKTYPGVERSALCMIFERVIKDPDCDRILKEYLLLFQYVGVPIDIALRDTTCEFMSWDRPTFEAQVWSVIQERFGEAYGAQNPRSITTRDANAMAGALLFLHTSLHNENARGSRITMDEFVRNGNECVEFPFPEDDMREMYHRVARQKWKLDELKRTPQQVEMEKSLSSIPSRLRQHRVRSNASIATDTGNDGIASTASRSENTGSSHKYMGGDTDMNHHETTLLNSSLPPYTTDPECFKLRESYHQRYVNIATQHLWTLECEHRLQSLEMYRVQPYAVPYYAQHIRPMLLMLYPQIVATLYMGFRVLEEQPIFRLIVNTYQMLYNVAAAFVLNLAGLRVAVERKIQRCLSDEGSQQLPPPIRPTFTLPLMNLL
ncbi:Sec7 domain [Trypanosoma melophagium]|uniref:Sec7 domain n=1 Tax=Trypanosoma melophagium TaxID=715481 RepID=UPI00351A3A11|nr:Sec7 domain [Trypanosoma melophagium]